MNSNCLLFNTHKDVYRDYSTRNKIMITAFQTVTFSVILHGCGIKSLTWRKEMRSGKVKRLNFAQQ